MENITFKLPEKAKEIIESLAKNELNQQNFLSYLASCCTFAGYIDAANYFHNESRHERDHFQRLCEFLQGRGIEAEMPSVEKPKIEFSDLKSGIKAAFLMEIEATKLYDQAYKDMRDIDSLAYIELQGMLGSQQYALKKYGEMWTIFKQLEGFEDQREAEVSYFASNCESGLVKA